jgi:membrane protease YdiL (CAAX protease family)
MLLIIPWQSVRGIRLLDTLVVRDPGARLSFYRSAIVSQWALAVIALAAMWSAEPRYVAELFSSRLTSDALLVLGFATLALLSQSPLIPVVRDRMERSGAMRRMLYPMRNILPRSAAEKNLWVTVSMTAGICEEILFRAFLFFYAQSIIGLEAAGAVALSTAIFAVGHVYQGTANMFRVAIIGTILGVVFAATDNLVYCMALHAFVDLGALRMDTFVPGDDTIESTDIGDA